MLNLFALLIIAISILLAVFALLREPRKQAAPVCSEKPRGWSVIFDPTAAGPAILPEFDPGKEALLVQMPARQVANLNPAEFSTRPIAGGTGQDILFRNRVLLRLPGISASRRVDLFVEPSQI